MPEGDQSWPSDRQDPEPDINKLGTFSYWTPEMIGQYFTNQGYGEYEQIWAEHKINGKRAVLLQRPHVEKMGVEILGDQLGIQKELRNLKREARKAYRSTILEAKTEAYDGSCLEYNCEFCCGLCPMEPNRYELTPVALKIKSYEISRLCGFIKCACLGAKWANDTIKLSKIQDADSTLKMSGVACLAENKCVITIATKAGTGSSGVDDKARGDGEGSDDRTAMKYLLLEADEGPAFCAAIREAMEELADEANKDKA